MSDYDDFTFSQQELEELSAFEASVRSVPQAAPLAGEAVAVSRPSAIASTSKSMEEESATPSLAPAVVEFDLESSDLDGETTSSGLTSRRSLFHRFRPWNSLAVTDLSAPGYCEVKHQYDLLGKRHLAPEHRPATVPRKDGRKITVNKKTQATADRILEAGKAVHKKLELEVHPEQRVVVTDTRADRAALRLINVLVNLSVLNETGVSREIPIHGILDGFYVSGVIDEVERRALPKREKAKTPNKAHPVQANSFYSNLDSYFKCSPSKPKVQNMSYELVLKDHKTRASGRMPHSTFTKPNRMQLSIYKRLWDDLATKSFDWKQFYDHHHVQPDTELSESFRSEIQPLLLSPDLANVALSVTVKDVVDAAQHAFTRTGSLSGEMEIIYRTRGSSDATSRRRRGETFNLSQLVSNVSSPVYESEQEEEDMQRAISLSLQADASKTEETSSEPNVIKTPTRQSKRLRKSTESITSSDQAGPSSQPKSNDKEHNLTQKESDDEDQEQQEPGNIIGTERFNYIASELDKWLARIGSYWRSEREPEGVAAKDVSFKCHSCEYREDCEWLESKAVEAHAEARSRRIQRETNGSHSVIELET